MPVDYKLRNLRRLFGEPNFLRSVVKGEAQTASKSAAAAGGRGGVGGGLPGLSGNAQALASTTPSTSNSGGIARPFFREVAPRAIKGKPVSGHLFSVYLYEKQKMKVYYGAMKDKQFREYVRRAKAKRRNTDTELMRLLECRLDTTLYRSGFVVTPMMARQWIFHGHVLINDRVTTFKRFELTPGDVISIRPGFESHAYAAQLQAAEYRKDFNCGASWLFYSRDASGMCPWLEIDRSGLAIAMVRYPTLQEMEHLKHALLVPFIRDPSLDPHAAMRSYR